ncbi:MAG: hypothetical protein IKS45_06585 [Thermoguttaceae bacterium]|nr:hypothetical protein [Thermoguttaceae bacterium]
MVTQIDLSIPTFKDGGGVRAWTIAPFFFSRSNRLLAPLTSVLVNPDRSIAESHSEWFPVTLVGPTHTGKTGWISGVYWTWVRSHPRLKSLYITAPDFYRDFRNAQLTRTFSDFEERFRALRFLAITNIQQLLQEPDAQEELVFILDTLAEKQVPVLMSVNEDEQSEGWNAKLVKRMQSGALIKTESPDEELCRAYAQDALKKLLLPPDYSDFIASWVASRGHLSITAVKGELLRLDLGYRQALMEPETIANGITESHLILWASQTSADREPLKIHDIAKLAVKEFGITLADLKSSSRRKTSVLTRGAVVYLGRKLGSFTLEQLADYLGGRDHSTIIHSLRNFTQQIETDPQLKKTVLKLERALA